MARPVRTGVATPVLVGISSQVDEPSPSLSPTGILQAHVKQLVVSEVADLVTLLVTQHVTEVEGSWIEVFEAGLNELFVNVADHLQVAMQPRFQSRLTIEVPFHALH